MRALIVYCLMVVALSSSGGLLANPESGAAEPVQLRVQVLDEKGKPIENAALLVNDQTASTGQGPYLSARAESARVYQLRVSAPGYYSMLHSFSEQERQLFAGKMPDITLVRKIPGRVMVAFAGDAMVGRRYHEPNPGDPRLVSPDDRLADSKSLLSAIKPYLELADYSSINLETPIVDREPTAKSTKTVTFFSYPETLEALSWAGVDHVSLGNNHTFDYFDAALKETLDRLANSNLGYSGAGMNVSTALRPHRTDIEEVPYSFFGYVGWAGRVQPSQVAEGDSKGGAALGTQENIVGSVSAESAGRVSVVEYHGGKEYSFAPTDETRQRLHQAIDSGADIAVGHHPHVLHGFELYKGKLIAYSLGNFMFDQYIYETQRSALLYVWMDGEVFHRAEIVPLYIKTYRPTPALGDVRGYVLRRLGQQSFEENIALGFSGGHGVITKALQSPGLTQTEHQIVGAANPQLIEPNSWREQFKEISFNADGVSYRVGRDWWSLGDHEQEDQFGLVNRSWKFSSAGSGIGSEWAQGNYAMKIIVPEKDGSASVGQQYFTRVWDERAKTIALDISAQADVEVRACVELRTGDMTTSQGRLKPVVSCLDPVTVSAGDWRPVSFDFDPPPREGNRGLRFRFDISSSRENSSPGPSSVYFDNLKLISWEQTGVSKAGEPVSLEGNKRWNILELSPLPPGQACCTLITTHY